MSEESYMTPLIYIEKRKELRREVLQGFPDVRLAGFPAVFFFRRSSGGLEGLSAVFVAEWRSGGLAGLPAVFRAGCFR